MARALNCNWWKYSQQVYNVGWTAKYRSFSEEEREAVIDFNIGLAALVIGSILQINRSFTKAFYVGVIIFISCIVLLAFLVYCYSSKHMRAWLTKKFYV